MAEPNTYSHYRPANTDQDIVYRVVGNQNDIVLLEVKHNAKRVHSGNLVTATKGELENDFEEASNPDKKFSLLRTTRGIIQGLVWTPFAFWYRFK